MKKVAILGAGSWAIGLGSVLWDNGHYIKMWEIDKNRAEELSKKKVLYDKLPDVKIPENNFEISSDLEYVVKDVDYIVVVVPSVYFRGTIQLLKNFYKNKIPIISATKGLENKTFKFMTQIIEEVIEESFGRTVALSGPTHAEEVVKRMPTTIVSASKNIKLAKEVQKLFSNKYFRVYSHYDELGVQLSGAVKNVIAIAAGIGDGLGLGDNAKAALITRGLVEMERLGKVLGAQSETITGLAGIGDLIVTCTSKHSRNRYLGEMLGKGKKLKDILDEMTMVAEGVPTCEAIYNYAKKLELDLPIVVEVYNILFKDKSPNKALEDLMNRELKQEGFYL